MFRGSKGIIGMILVTSIFVLSLSANPIPYSQVDKKLLEVWNQEFPVPYTEIRKKDLFGKGIIYYKENSLRVGYLYSFLVFLPRYARGEGMQIQAKEEGREVIVRLLHFPSDKNTPFEIRVGEFEESHNTKSHLRYIK